MALSFSLFSQRKIVKIRLIMSSVLKYSILRIKYFVIISVLYVRIGFRQQQLEPLAKC